ncbi:MAG: UDP-glucuronic acid decarboxylase family protein [Janthinobacterium lividum]
MRDGRKLALVAGGAGFIGSALCDALLAGGARVVCLDNLHTGSLDNLRHLDREPGFEFVEADVVDPLPARVRGRAFTHVFNLACPASPPHYQADPEHTMMTNVIGTRNLLRLAEAKAARFLLTSTSEVYGDPEVHPQHEGYRGEVNCTGPRACYDEGKRAAEALSFDFERMNRAEIRVARIFNTYGPRMRPDDGRVVSNMICQALTGDDITVFGDGSQSRSFCYVDDLVAGLIGLMAHDGPLPGPVNLGNPNELTVNELVEEVLALTGSDSRVVRRPLPVDDPRRRRPDIGRAADLLGWAPHIELRQGLRATIAWFEQALSAAKPAPIRSMRAAVAPDRQALGGASAS